MLDSFASREDCLIRHMLSTLAGCDGLTSVLDSLLASGSRHIAQSSGPSKIVAANPRAKKSSLNANGGGGGTA